MKFLKGDRAEEVTGWGLYTYVFSYICEEKVKNVLLKNEPPENNRQTPRAHTLTYKLVSECVFIYTTWIEA